MDLKTLEKYACASERTLRDWIHSPTDPLPASQRGGKIRVSRRAFDLWMERQPVRAAEDVNRIVKEIVGSVRTVGRWA
jgi:Helix-turn-helix domain